MKGRYDRPVLLEEHPVYDRRYLVPTEPIRVMLRTMKESIRYGFTGTCFYGHTRWGKSRALRYCALSLARDTPGLPLLVFSAPETRRRGEDHFLTSLLTAIGHPDTKSGTLRLKHDRLTARMKEMAEASGRRLFLVFIDEAQRYELVHWKWMKEIHEVMEKYGCRLCFFLIGQPELVAQKNEFCKNHPEIAARFFAREYPFHGIQSAGHLKTTLAGYDGSTFPEQSEWMYTRFFLPHAFDAGLRVADSADVLWAAFQGAYRYGGFEAEMELPMENVTRAIEIALMDSMDQDDHDFHLTPAIWDRAVALSGFVGDLERLRMSTDHHRHPVTRR